MFYPMGSEYFNLAEHLPAGLHARHQRTVAEDGARAAEYSSDVHEFYFPIDMSIYQAGRARGNAAVLFLARPELDRRCYELGIAMLAQFKRRNPDVEVVLYGSAKIPSESIPFCDTSIWACCRACRRLPICIATPTWASCSRRPIPAWCRTR